MKPVTLPPPQDRTGASPPESIHRPTRVPAPTPAPASPGKRRWIAPTLLFIALAAVGAGLVLWKLNALRQAQAAAAHQPEPVESISVALAAERQHQTTTISIGTVVALRSIQLRNELPGTVREVSLAPGQVVEAGTLLVALDVAVEEAELQAQEAEAALAETQLNRMERAVQSRATSQMEVDRARAELDVARARSARIRAIIGRKSIRAPFRARIGLSDLHPGQYLEAGALLTTLQGVDDAAYVDFAVPQQVAEQLRPGGTVEVVTGPGAEAVPADIVAADARVDPATRNTTVRARVAEAGRMPPPGASVRVRVPAGPPVSAVAIPVSALRRGPEGDHVFVIAPDPEGKPRARTRRVGIGAVLAEEALVTSGLSAGETVAAFGSFKLREGARVSMEEGNAPGSAAN